MPGKIYKDNLFKYHAVKKWGREITITYTFPNLETVCCSMSCSNCCFLTCIQISQEAGKVVWYSHLFSTVCCDLPSQRLWHNQ